MLSPPCYNGVAWGASVSTLYLVAAGLFQLAVVGLILLARPLDRRTAGVAVILGLAAGETAIFLLWPEALPDPIWAALMMMDLSILATTAFVLSQLPSSLGGRQGGQRAAKVWIGVLALLVVGGLAGYLLVGRTVAYEQTLRLVNTVFFAAGAGLLALHVVPRWAELDEGPLKVQTALVAAGLVAAVAYWGSRWMLGNLMVPDRFLRPNVVEGLKGGFNALAGWFTLAALVRLGIASGSWPRSTSGSGRRPTSRAERRPSAQPQAQSQAQSQRAQPHAEPQDQPQAQQQARPQSSHLLFLGLLGLLATLGFLADLKIANADEIVSQTLRPGLLAIAILGYDLVRLPERVQRVAGPAVLGGFALLLFLASIQIYPDPATGAGAIGMVPALTGVAVVVGSLLLMGRGQMRGVFLDPTADARGRQLHRYTLELERWQREGGDISRVEALREALGITPAEHRTLDHVLRTHLVIPVTQVRGLRAGDVVDGTYEILEPLGQGGFGQACLARERDTGRSVVVKRVLRPWEQSAPGRRAALRRERQVGDEVTSPHLARTLDLFEHEQSAYLVREHIPGTSLAQRIDDDGPLAADELTALAHGLLEGLAELHARGFLHLDLKPGNVILDPDRGPVIIDYGAACRRRDPEAKDAGQDAGLDAGSQAAGLEVTETMGHDEPVAGSIAWMAPEQVRQETLDPCTDLFALGAVLYHAATGEPHVPIEDRSRFAVQQAITDGRPPELPDAVAAELPGPLAEAIRSCLRRDPEDRPASATALLDALAGPDSETGRG